MAGVINGALASVDRLSPEWPERLFEVVDLFFGHYSIKIPDAYPVTKFKKSDQNCSKPLTETRILLLPAHVKQEKSQLFQIPSYKEATASRKPGQMNQCEASSPHQRARRRAFHALFSSTVTR